jgi:hypothetical protein
LAPQPFVPCKQGCNGIYAEKQPGLGSQPVSAVERRSERADAIVRQVAKWQAGNVDPLMEASRGAPFLGERKVVTRDRSRSEVICGVPGSTDPVAGENGRRGAEW